MTIMRVIFAFLILLMSTPAHAADTPFGLAMHGKAKYGPDARVLDYVNPNATKGGTLKMAGIGTFDTVNPFSIKGKAAEGLNLVYDRLMTRVWDEPFTLYPLIAQRADVAPDRSAITFTLNPKARFHDGTPITVDDVIFSFETLKTQGRPNMRRVYQLVKSVTKPTPASVKFSLSAGYDRETVMIVAMMPVLSKKFWTGKTFDKAILENPVANGPYKSASINPGRSITYERVKDYWAKDIFPNIGQFNPDKITYDYYRDDTIAFEAFKSGNLDLRREYDAGQWADAYDFPAALDGRVKLDAIPHGRPEKTRGFIFNTRREPFNDIRVRKAFTLLLDFEWINQNLFHNQYKRITSYFPNSELAADYTSTSSSKPSPTTPAQRRANMLAANKLLNEAGWIVKDGKRMKDGKPLVFEMTLSAPEDEKIAINYKNALKKMGIDVNIRVLDAANYIGRLNDYDFDMTLYYWTSSLSPGTEQILYWGCQAAKEKARWNYAGICDPVVDKLAASIANTTDRATLVSTVRAMDKILMDGYYMVPLYYAGKDYVAYWNKVQKPQKSPLYGMVVESWWMKPEAP